VAVASYTSTFTASTVVSTTDAAGLIFFASSDGTTYYGVTLNATAGVVALQRWSSFVLTSLASAPVDFLLPSAFYAISVTYSAGGIMAVSINGLAVFTVSDIIVSPGGFVGLYAATSAMFRSLSFVVPCSIGTCSQTLSRGVCQFACPTGFLPSSNGTLTCNLDPSGQSASWSGSPLTCILPPPVFYGAYITTPESQSTGTIIGDLVATSSSPTAVVLFSILSGNTNGAFWINSCSGQIKVLNESALDFLVTPSFNLTVQVYLSSSPSSFTNAGVAIFLTPVATPPTVSAQFLTVPEHSLPGIVLGVLNYTSRLPMNVTWSLGVDTSGGLFDVDPTTGIVSVSNLTTYSSLDYFGPATIFSLSVTATDVLSLSRSATNTLIISLTEINNPPRLSPSFQVGEHVLRKTAS
jgi:hypothetical protein